MAQPAQFMGSLPVYVRDSGTGNWYVVGGGGQSVDPKPIDWLTDVDTVTNLPLFNQALIWDDTAKQWVPGGPHLKLSGGAMDANADIILGVNPPPDPLSATPRDWVEQGLAGKSDINHSHTGGTAAFRDTYYWTSATNPATWVDTAIGIDTLRFDSATKVFISKKNVDGTLTSEWWLIVNPNDRILIVDEQLSAKGEYTVTALPIDHGNVIELEIAILPGCTDNTPVVNSRTIFVYFQQPLQGVYLPTVGGTMTGDIDFADNGEGVVLSNKAKFSKETTGTTTIRKGNDNGQPQIREFDGSVPRDILDTVNGLPLVGGHMTGEIYFDAENLGITTFGGGRFYKKSGGGVVIRESSAGQQPRIENYDSSNGRDILDTINGDARYSPLSHTHPVVPPVATSTTFQVANGATIVGNMNKIMRMGNMVIWQVMVKPGVLAENTWTGLGYPTDRSYGPASGQNFMICVNEDGNNANGVSIQIAIDTQGNATYYKYDAGHNFTMDSILSLSLTYLK